MQDGSSVKSLLNHCNVAAWRVEVLQTVVVHLGGFHTLCRAIVLGGVSLFWLGAFVVVLLLSGGDTHRSP